MSRYVDISELEIPSDECSYEELEVFVETVYESEYIDICFCGECKQRTDRDYKVWGKGFCEMLRGWTKDDDYCAWGEREDDFCSYGERKSDY